MKIQVSGFSDTMYFELPIKIINCIDTSLLEIVNQKMIEYESNNEYNFQHENWHRLDSYHNPTGVELYNVVGQKFIDTVMVNFPKHVLFGWSLSHLPGKTKITEHVDRRLLHRLAMRIIVPVSNTPDVLNWHYSNDKFTRRYYMLEYGNIYRLNTAATHGLVNNNTMPRRAVYFDVMPERIFNKFKDNYEITKVTLTKASGVIYVL